mgnify:CR=1 FL=1
MKNRSSERKKRKSTFTLTEVLITIIIIGILSTVGIISFRKAIISSRDKEAQAMLKLIAQSEEAYRLESGGEYCPCSDTSSCNTLLDLSIPSGTTAAWSYEVHTRSSNSGFCAQAQNTTAAHFPSTRTFHIQNGEEEPQPGLCPY